MKKVSLTISIMLVFSFIVVVSCRKEVVLDYVMEKISNEDPMVQEARLSFLAEYGKKKTKFRSSVASVSPDRNGNFAINMRPAWSYAKKVNTPKLQGVEIPVSEPVASRKMFNYDKVPISPEDNKLRARNSFKRLLYYKTGSGRSFNIILSYLPDVAYVKKFSGRISKSSITMRTIKATKYSGYIEYSRLDGRGIFVLQFKEGELVRRHTYKYEKSTELSVTNVANTASSTNKKVENGAASARMALAAGVGNGQCEECTPIMIRACAGELEEEEVEDDDCGEWKDSGQVKCTPIDCPDDPTDPEHNCWPNCGDPCYDQNGYYICDPENPDPNEPWWDCAGVKFGTAYLCPDGTCIGGTTGVWECAKITDDLDSFPCAKNLLQQLPSLKTDIASSINQIFGGNDYNVNFIGIEYTDPNVDGKAYSGNLSASPQQYTIGLDSTMLKNATKEYIIATMYHEIIHAFFYAEQHRLPQGQFPILYPGIQPYTVAGTIKYQAVPGHSNMISYIDDIKQAILSFNPSFPPTKAEALAKAGIVFTTVTENQINNDEKNSTNNSSGQKCP